MRKTSSIARRLATGSIIYGLGDVITRFASILLVPLYTRLLSPRDYGTLAAVGILMVPLIPLMNLSLSNAITKGQFDAGDTKKRRELYGTVYLFTLIWGGLLCICLCTVGRPLVEFFLRGVAFSPYLQIGIGISFFSALASVPLAMLQAQHRPVAYRLFTTLSFLVSTGLIIYLVAVHKLGALGSLYGQVIAGAIMAVAYMVLMLRSSTKRIAFPVLRYSLLFSVPLVFSGYGRIIIDLAPRYFLQHFSTLANLGLYNLANQYAGIIMVLCSMVNMAWMPIFFEAGKRENARETYAKFGELLFSGMAVFSLVLIVFAPEVIHIFADPRYHSASNIAPMLVVNYVLDSPAWILITYPMMLENQARRLIWVTFFAGGLSLILSYFFVQKWGAQGAASAVCLARLSLDVIAYGISAKVYRIPYRSGRIGLAALTAVLLGFTCRHIVNQPIVLRLACKAGALAAYGGFLIYLDLISVSGLQRGLNWLRSLRLPGEVAS
ncbi:MAG: lipopolysaccharide biosynthesis protein [Armatimonadota bacterium]